MKKFILTFALVLALAFSGISGSVSASAPEDTSFNGTAATTSSEASDPQDPNPKDPDDPIILPNPGSTENDGAEPYGPFPPKKDEN